MLDIGCNSGVLTLKLLDPEFRARSVLGVDIDPELVHIPNENVHGIISPIPEHLMISF